MNRITIKQTFKSFDDAVAAAKENGNNIYDGYETSMGASRDAAERMGAKEYHLTENNDIIYVIRFEGQKVLSRVKVGCGVSAGRLLMGQFVAGNFMQSNPARIEKGDWEARALACSNGMTLVCEYEMQRLADK